MPFDSVQMAKRAAQEIAPGSIVNLGIGLPTLVADYIEKATGVWLHTENGILGMGPFPLKGQADPQIINAGKQTVTIAAGGSCFDSALSFAMIRGGHIDLAILGGMQISAHGDLANWSIPGGKTLGIGGAMDLAAGAKRIVAMMKHLSKNGEAKLVDRCSFPLTAQKVVSRIITDLGVFDVDSGAFRIVELAPDVTIEQIQQNSDAKFL
ncbi:MAG: 3-oxoacid CoA-transferase subunit B [Myxococcales bacterium]|nr:MAG: 3-oxoacid CoA-transferase subunit B [Myxococcales bacterium]